jgi:hypothetical protein
LLACHQCSLSADDLLTFANTHPPLVVRFGARWCKRATTSAKQNAAKLGFAGFAGAISALVGFLGLFQRQSESMACTPTGSSLLVLGT